MTNDELLEKVRELVAEKGKHAACPSCGHCPACGHTPQRNWAYPYNPYPYNPWYSPRITWGTWTSGGIGCSTVTNGNAAASQYVAADQRRYMTKNALQSDTFTGD